MKNKLIKYCLHGAFLLSFPSILFANIYQKTDATGAVHFSDSPTDGAVPFELKPVNTYHSTTVIKTNVTEKKSQAPIDPKNYYNTFSVVQPADQVTFQNQRDIPVAVELSPNLKPEDKIAWWLDGSLYKESNEKKVTLTQLTPGTHWLQAKIVGKHSLETAVITFYIHYTHQNEKPQT